ncbi:unnamed protein product, partial [Rotaria sp. Silwood2]
MTESNSVSSVNEDINSTNNTEQQETTTTTTTTATPTVTNDESNQEVTVVPTEDTTNENVIDENKTEEKEQILESSSNINTKESESQSKEPSSERQFQDAEKATEDDEEVYDDNDSEYEDVDDEEDEETEGKNSAEVSNKTSNKTATEEDDEHINIKPRRLPKKRDENEHSEGYEDDDSQHAPNTKAKSTRRTEKKSDKNLDPLDDDNDARNPAYIPRKGKFYEHDDRTNDEPEQEKQEPIRNRNRPYRDSEAKWQHDLYYNYEDESNARQSNYRGQRHGRFRRGGGGGGGDDRNQLHLNDYIPPAQRGRGGGGYRQQQYYDEGNDYRQRPPPYAKSRNDRINNFEFEDYNRSSSYNNNRGRGNRTNYVEPQTPPRRQRRDFEQYQTEEQPIPPRRSQQHATAEQTFHRERNFTNTQFQQQRNVPKNNNNRDDQKQSTEQTHEVSSDDNKNRNRNQRRENNEPPRRQVKNNRNQQYQQQQNEPSTTGSNLSAEAPSFERSKRYSNMRSNASISGQQHQQQPPLPVQQPQIPMQTYQDQRTGYYDQNHWQQAPPPATYLPQQQQMIPTQMYHPQQPIPTQAFYVPPQYQQAAQYVPMNYPQGSIPPQEIMHILILFCLFKIIIGGEHQRRLLKYLLDENNHNPLERPVYNDSHSLIVTMNMALQQIIDFDEKNEILAVSGWIVLAWHDYSLQWKPEEFGNIQTIRIPSTRVWTPDILLYNSADLNFEGINLTTDHSEGQLDAYVQSGEWDLEAFIVVRKAVVYECCPTVYPFVLFTIRIRRRTLYYVVNVVVPCVLISFMTVLGFLLPPDSGEKLTLQITILLSIVMFSLLIAGIIPASSTALPTIVMYFTTVMCMCSMSVVATVFVLVLHHRNAKNHTMPMW